jgi:hypothetical protein
MDMACMSDDRSIGSSASFTRSATCAPSSDPPTNHRHVFFRHGRKWRANGCLMRTFLLPPTTSTNRKRKEKVCAFLTAGGVAEWRVAGALREEELHLQGTPQATPVRSRRLPA